MKKKYIIVGDNNFWYATTDEITDEQLTAEIKDLKKRIKNREFEDRALKEVEELFVYEAKEVQRINL